MLTEKTCPVCGRPFMPKSYNGKYCADCRIKELHRQKAEWLRNYRARLKQQTAETSAAAHDCA